MNETINQLGIEIDDLRNEKQALESEINELNRKNAKLEGDLLALRRDVAIYQSTLAAVSAQLRTNADILETIEKLLTL